jgi:benzil reductase ((S)-benzoin forming)
MKTVIITGTSSGLGQAFFDMFSRESVHLLCIARRFLPYQEELAREHHERINLIPIDLRDVERITAKVDFTKLLPIDEIDELIFINNAAVVEPIGAVGQLDQEKIIEAVQVNVTAPFLLTNALFAVPKLVDSNIKIKVLNISSGAAKRTIDGWALYCAAKAGGEMFYDVLAEQYNNTNTVSIHNVNPGVMDTQMQEKIRSANNVHFPNRDRFVNLKNEGQLPSPQEVAQNIVKKFLN